MGLWTLWHPRQSHTTHGEPQFQFAPTSSNGGAESYINTSSLCNLKQNIFQKLLLLHCRPSTTMSDRETLSACIPNVVPPPDPSLRIIKHGIYAVAYEHLPSSRWTSHIRAWIEQYFVSFTHLPYARRLLGEIFLLAPGTLIGYICATLWLSISNALVLFFLGSIFSFVSDEP